MAIDDLLVIKHAQVKVASFIEAKRPPADIRPKLDLGFTYEKGVFLLHETRPHPIHKTKYVDYPFAKLRWIQTQHMWKLYWKRASGAWDLYEHNIEDADIHELLTVIDDDSYGCFFG
jgi:hypothetical protein